jgi:hypothetical protein
MNDTDPELAKKAMEIGASKMTIEEKTDAIWTLYQERKTKLAEERKKKVSFVLPDERGTPQLLCPQSREVSGASQGVSSEESREVS